jgi:UDP-glucose 4-epimerase
MNAAMPDDERFSVFAGAACVVTGGLGFIGATLARRLAALGGEVLVLDAMLPGSGANDFNLDGIADRIAIVRCDIRDADAMRRHLAGKTFLFNLAAQTSHQGSMLEPLLDLDINCRAQLALLETCRAVAPDIAIVFASTRQIYGRPEYLPVDEKHPVRPPDVNGIDKAAAESFHLLYNQVYGLRSTALRLTNTYGPRMRIADARQTFVGHWLRAVIEEREFEVWGGEQLRDLTYVDDAVEAFLLAAVTPDCAGRAFNIGGEALTLLRLAELLVSANGGGSFAIREFPADRKRIDIGGFTSDDTLFRTVAGWAPRTGIAAGLTRSLAFFRANLAHYRKGL